MTKYKYLILTGKFPTAKIKKKEIDDYETEHSVWINGIACRKKTSLWVYCDTFEEAQSQLSKYTHKLVSNAKSTLERAERVHAAVQDLKPE